MGHSKGDQPSHGRQDMLRVTGKDKTTSVVMHDETDGSLWSPIRLSGPHDHAALHGAAHEDFTPVGPSPTPALNFSFACGGWLQFYMFGVGRCLQMHGLERVDPARQKVIGASAGALTAAGLALGGSFDAAVDMCKNDFMPICRSTWTGPFRISEYLRKCMAASVDMTKGLTLTGQLTVVVTKFPSLKAVRINKFLSVEHMMTALLASAAAIPLAQPQRLDGGWCIDGGLTQFQPRLAPEEGETVYVNPFYFSDADIKPSRYIPMWWAFLPPNDKGAIDWLYDLGYMDCLAWMERRGLSHLCDHPCNCNADAPAAEGAAAEGERGGQLCPCQVLGRQGISGPTSSITGGPLGCPRRPKRGPHNFDVRGRTSFQRFFGYKLWGISSHICDALLVFWLAVLWKPFTFFLIYLELAVQLSYLVLKGVTMEVLPVLPYALVAGAILLPQMVGLTVYIVALMCLIKFATVGFHGSKEWRALVAYKNHLLSPRLLLRTIPVVGKRYSQHVHQTLEKSSVVYRMALHFI